MSEPRIKTTVVGSYPVPDWLGFHPSEQQIVDATRIILHTQETAGIDVVCDGEVYRYDLSHPETNGMIEYFVPPDGRHPLGIHLRRTGAVRRGADGLAQGARPASSRDRSPAAR